MSNYKELSIEELMVAVSRGERGAYYWLAMAYWGRGDYANAVEWFEKTMNDAGNEWAGKATSYLAMAHEGGYHPQASMDEAIRLFESLSSNPNSVISRLHLGLLYCEGQSGNCGHDVGKRLVEDAVASIVATDGNDGYLSQIECFRIGGMYFNEDNAAKATEYLQKAIDRCDAAYPDDQTLIELARISIDECKHIQAGQTSETPTISEAVQEHTEEKPVRHTTQRYRCINPDCMAGFDAYITFCSLCGAPLADTQRAPQNPQKASYTPPQRPSVPRQANGAIPIGGYAPPPMGQ